MGHAQIKAQKLHAAIDELSLTDMEQVLDFIAYLKSRASKHAKRESQAKRQAAMIKAMEQLLELNIASRFGDASAWQREARQDRILPERT